MVKILLVVPSLNIGGTERHILQVYSRIQEKYSVNLFSLEAFGELEEAFTDSKILVQAPTLRLFGYPSVICKTVSLFTYIMKMKPDIIHFYLPEAYIIGGLCSLPFKKIIKIMSRRNMNEYQLN